MSSASAFGQVRGVVADHGVINDLPEKPHVDAFREQVDIELEFIEKVCELTPEQVGVLRAEADRVVERAEASLKKILDFQAQAQRRAAVVVNGRAVAVVAGENLEVLTAPGSVVRRELDAAVHQALPAGWGTKLDAERQRLELRAKQTSILGMLALLDDQLMLAQPQRDDLDRLLRLYWMDAWRQPANAAALVTAPNTALRMLASVPESALASVLRPAQLTAWRTVVPNTARKALFNGRRALLAAPQAPAGGGARPVQPRAPVQPPQPVQAPAPANAAGVRRRLPAAAPAPGNAQRAKPRTGLDAVLELTIDEIAAACKLNDAQREKLLLAGKLDIKRYNERMEAYQQEFQQKRQAARAKNMPLNQADLGTPPSAADAFNDDDSHYQKALRSRLTAEQNEQLAAAHERRQAFRREANLAAVVQLFADRAHLTSAQCEQLSRLLAAGRSADASTTDSRWEVMCDVARMPDKDFEPLFDGFQAAAAEGVLDEIRAVTQRFHPGGGIGMM